MPNTPFSSFVRSGWSVVGLSLVVIVGAAGAASGDGRYTMHPTEGGLVRLDTETGAVSLCSKRGNDWACEAMPDSQASMRKEIETLKAENQALKDEIKRFDEVLGLGDKKSAEKSPGATGKLELPNEQDVDKAFDYLERMMKKLRERMKRLDGSEPNSQRL